MIATSVLDCVMAFLTNGMVIFTLTLHRARRAYIGKGLNDAYNGSTVLVRAYEEG